MIISCDNFPSNCVADGKTYCVVGHIGPLCESCDLYGNLWVGASYAKEDSFSCTDCSLIMNNIWLLIMMNAVYVFYILFSIIQTKKKADRRILAQYVRKLRFLPTGVTAEGDNSSIYLKMFINYM